MLKHLTVQDFALVEHLSLDLTGGLTVITGESGAGKSILLAAISLVLGERASADLVRPGAKRADVTAEFDLTDQPDARHALASQELDDEELDGHCIVRRTVSGDGRSRAFINGNPVTLAVLRALTESLVEVHGQHANLRLAAADVQLALIDDFAGARDSARAVRELFSRMQSKQKEAAALRALLERDTDRSELLRYQLDELDTLELAAGEFEALETEHKRLSQVEDYRRSVETALAAIDALDELRASHRAISELEDDHATLATARQTLADAMDLLNDASAELRRYAQGLEPDPERLNQVDGRLSDIHQLSRKHQTPATHLTELADALREELDGMAADTSNLDALGEEISALEAQFEAAAKKLSTRRRKAAKKFDTTVTKALKQLALPKASLESKFEDHRSERGIDRCNFWATTNPKYPAGPLQKIASGGELARISLAIQITAARTSHLPCLILDEADVGVGGTTADTIGRLLRDLGAHTQVLCVTHAPQVAALGNQHLKVSKSADEDTQIADLDEAERLAEVARMLAGADVTEKTREYAASLLADAT